MLPSVLVSSVPLAPVATKPPLRKATPRLAGAEWVSSGTTVGGTSQNLNGIAFNGSSRLVVVGNLGTIFAGDYNNVAIGPDQTAWAFWTDARNGRSARQQVGRNPICEQSDVFDDEFSASSGGTIRNSATQSMDLYLATPCPVEAQDKGAKGP